MVVRNFSYNTDFKIPILDEYKQESYETRSQILKQILNEKYNNEDEEHHTPDRFEGMEYEYGEIDGSHTAD